ncbi:MAG: DUF1566 domain-containing protein [Bacteroidia bacterium]|nr:DUF1566 domain-containing protein [Bacteroidia bacterium]
MNKNRVVQLLEDLVTAVKEQPVEAAGKTSSVRFTVLNDGWVLDLKTGLEWGPTSSKRLNFEEAQKYCASLSARLPTVKELYGLVDIDKYDPAIDKEIFKDTESEWYWTSSKYKPDSSYAWCVGFYNGRVFDCRNDSIGNILPVRDSRAMTF